MFDLEKGAYKANRCDVLDCDEIFETYNIEDVLSDDAVATITGKKMVEDFYNSLDKKDEHISMGVCKKCAKIIFAIPD